MNWNLNQYSNCCNVSNNFSKFSELNFLLNFFPSQQRNFWQWQTILNTINSSSRYQMTNFLSLYFHSRYAKAKSREYSPFSCVVFSIVENFKCEHNNVVIKRKKFERKLFPMKNFLSIFIALFSVKLFIKTPYINSEMYEILSPTLCAFLTKIFLHLHRSIV